MPNPQNISNTPKQAYLGLNLDSVASQIKEGQFSYCLNGQVENFDGNSLTLQNEQANELCTSIPEGYTLVGQKNIVEIGTIIVWSTNGTTSEIGKIVDCTYSTLINSPCINLSVLYPIQQAVTRYNGKSYEVYWAEGLNKLRYIDLGNLPFKEVIDGCNTIITDEVDCNRMNLQPNFSIPRIDIESTDSNGELIAGDYQFAVQYANALGEAYTAYYSVTNPLPIFDPTKITQDFNYPVNKSINVNIYNLDLTGLFTYINIAVVKTINNIASPELVGTFEISSSTYNFSYSGQSKTDVQLSMQDIFQKYEIYDSAEGITTAQDVLIPYSLTASERIAYQEIANKIKLQWQTFREKADKFYALPENSVNRRGYMRDEIYPFEFTPLLKNGKQCDRFYIPSRTSTPYDEEEISNQDSNHLSLRRWRVYNTGSISGNSPEYTGGPDYTGAYQFGEFSYWESSESVPCNDIYGELKDTKIRHHKFPDNNISPFFDGEYIYPIGLKIDVQQIYNLIQNSSLTQEQKDQIAGFKITRGNRATNKSIKAKGYLRNVGKCVTNDQTYYFPNYPYNDIRPDPFISTRQTDNDSGNNSNIKLDGFNSTESQQRFVFNSPDTSFFQPSLGSQLKLEGELSGTANSHFIPVQKHSQYKFPSEGAYIAGIATGLGVGIASASIGIGSTQVFDGAAAFTAYQTFIDIIYQTTPKFNYTYQYNSVGNYNTLIPIPNEGNKIRTTELSSYLTPGMINVGDEHTVNNFQRESSVYIKTAEILPFTSTHDESRIVNSSSNCDGTIKNLPISGWYASLKTPFLNQYGQLYSYESIDTGYQKLFSSSISYSTEYAFGGDVFINKFSFKTKIPFFIDNRVNAADEADIDYREFNNLGYPTYWFSSDADDASTSLLGVNIPFIPRKINNFDCDSKPFFYQKGKIYLFAYGIPTFFVESEVNVDARQAYNQAEGDFYPRVSSDIPDDWLQEKNTTIQYDNTYYYNKTFSKQNKENYFSFLPQDFTPFKYSNSYPFRAIFSESRTDSANPSLRNNWLIYKPASKFDFPENFGQLISLDGIESKQVLARFENKTLLYNALLTAPTSAVDVYLGQTLFSQQVPPLDYADTDSGYLGCQHKLLLKTEFGHITTDSKRGQVFLINGQNSEDLTRDGVSKFFTEFFDFEIIKHFPDVDIDNTYNGIGITGVYDTKYDRLILTKLDYKPKVLNITHENGKFVYNNQQIALTDSTYFCNYSFSISYTFATKSWTSFHSYLPSTYVPEANFFYSYYNNKFWRHCTAIDKFNNFYGATAPYIIEYPYSFQPKDQIIQSISDYTKALKYTDWGEYIETNDYFNEMVLYSNSQCSGILKLFPTPKNNLSEKIKYPLYNSDSKTILVTKTDSDYRINTFWDLAISTAKPIWLRSCESLSIFKALNQDNMSYSKRAFKKAPLRSKDLKIRLSLTDKDTIKLLSQFTILQSQNSII